MSITLNQPMIFGDTGGNLGARAHAANQTMILGSPEGTGTLVGDVLSIAERASGGDDTLSSGTPGPNVVIGDALTITDRGHGGNDRISASSHGTAFGLGDALTLSDKT